MRNVSIVVQGTGISRIDPSAQGATYDLKGLTVRFALTCARFLEFNWIPFSGERSTGILAKR